ncbi:hypothetical protein AZA_87106 [Nitrospirillum viridazoti Y2]|uniref:SMEK domain-containing protein n=1 Tax=Nitrospirillum amazonense TaxID=28077 RepID=A0A560HKF3_9PROT|nr:SMEK domain-containing protein [Nitrospirillum amazonense]EGY02472.1 hypothetical protein AZA_87106 [Nitrospirillum amazonense Y2]TWB46976.1 hypothetical protein FBZ92_14034 [Nitrospirillum amazonense]
MRQLDVANQLRDVVSRIILQVELATSQGRTDINLALEDAFIPILKSVYNLPHLVNLNRKQKNFPGIDLGDDHDRICFQVTSTTSLDKVKATVRQFMDRSYFNSFDELYVLTLTKKQASYSQAAVNELVDERFAFNCKKHIIDLGDLLGLVAALRITAQERVLEEFKRILGEADAYIAYSSDSIPKPTTIITNLQRIRLPQAVYVAELTIDDKEVIERARRSLSYRGKARSRNSVVKMALLLNDIYTDAWVCHDNKLFSFHDMKTSGLINIVDEGSAERLDVSDLAYSTEIDNVNVLKQLLVAEARELLKARHVRMQPKDRFFYFIATEEGQAERKEPWIGKQKAIRRVYSARPSKKDPAKVAHHQHLSFELTFANLDDSWYAQIVPSWFYSFDGFRTSNWHDDLLSQQKRLERNSSVRNQVRFIAYFLKASSDDEGLSFETLIEFGVGGDTDDVADDLDDTDISDDPDKRETAA